MQKIETTIFTEPVAKGRPKLTARNGKAFAYTPAKTRNSEAEIRCLIREEAMKCGQFEPGVPLHLEAVFYIEKPKSKPKKVTQPTTRPDITNYLKTLEDALNGYVYPDDSQITKITASKRYAKPGTNPRIEIRITEYIGDLD